MKYLCKKNCQIRKKDGKIWFINKGQVVEMDEPHKCFVAMENTADTPPEKKYSIDFATASEEELMEAKWKFTEAEAAILTAFKVKLYKDDKKRDVVKQILDAQYRSTGEIPKNFPLPDQPIIDNREPWKF